MTAFFIYLIKVIVCSALFAGCYWLALRNERFYQWNRFYIVASVVLSIIIPALNIPISAPNITMPTATVYFTGEQVEMTASLQSETVSIPWVRLGWMLFISIVLFLFVKEVVSFIRILRLKRSSERIHISEAVLYCTDDATAPFTFFGTIFWKKGISVDSGEGRCILRHELAHVRLGHSWDKALMQLVCCVFWMNPFFMLFRRELELVHEFAADSESSAEELSSLILCTMYPNNYRDFTSRFFQTSIKRRIFMIAKNKNKKSSMNMLRKLSIVPVALIALFLFACNFQSSETKPLLSEEEVIALDMAEEPDPSVVADIMPIFPGGFEALLKFLQENTVYPEKAKDNNIQGRVFVQFVVTSKGNIGTVKILRGVDPLLDAEAIRVVKSLPKFEPGKQKDGVAVPVWFHAPITFSLGNGVPLPPPPPPPPPHSH